MYRKQQAPRWPVIYRHSFERLRYDSRIFHVSQSVIVGPSLKSPELNRVIAANNLAPGILICLEHYNSGLLLLYLIN